MLGGSFWDRKDDDVWWYGRSRLATASYTWGGAENFSRFVPTSGRGTRLASPLSLDLGPTVSAKSDVMTCAGTPLSLT